MECWTLSLHFVRNYGMTLNIKLVDTFLSYLLEIMLYPKFYLQEKTKFGQSSIPTINRKMTLVFVMCNAHQS